MATKVRRVLKDFGFTPVAATNVSGTSDYLEKIVDLIRGCGFGVAIYSDSTPPRTLANIFFEVGLSHLLGKPVQLLVAGRNSTPSDFVRTEWVYYDPNQEGRSLTNLRAAFRAIKKSASYAYKLGCVAIEAEDVDYELAFERFKQAVLISDHARARKRIVEISNQLRANQQGPANLDWEKHRKRLLSSIDHFLKLLPRAT